MLVARMRSLFVRALTDREARIVVIFSLLSIAGGFFGNRLLTQVAQPEALGTYYLYANLAQWLSMPAAAGFVYVVHHWPIAREHGDTRRFSRALGMAVGLQGVIAVGGAIALRLSVRAAVSSNEAMLEVALLAFATGAFQLLCAIPNAERWRASNGALNLLGGNARPFVQAIGIVLFGAMTGLGLLGSAAWLQLLAAITAAILYSLAFRSTLSTAAPRPTDQLSIAAMLSYSIPGFFGVLIPQIATSIERWGLAVSRDTSATALFVQAMGMSVAVTGAVGSMIVGYYYPFATNAAARDTADPLGAAAPVLKRFYAVLFAAQLALSAVVILFVAPITSLAFGARFASVARLLPWTMVGASLFTIGAAMTAALFIARDGLWPNLARIGSQIAYVAALSFIPTGIDPAGRFVREYVAAQALYVIILALAIWRRAAARKARLATVPAGP